jgi:uncharacterized membrane protein
VTTEPPRRRDATVDALRGLAIAAMVWGHLGVATYSSTGIGATGATLSGQAPLWTETVGGIAPALFLFICGMMVAYLHARGAPLTRQLWRMLALLGVGAAIDVVFWRIRPFTTVDVLYCIAVVLVATHLFISHVPARARAWVATAALVVTPWLQRSLGYSDYPTEMSFDGRVLTLVANQTSILNHWIVDGWFPLFPWLGFALAGATLGSRRAADLLVARSTAPRAADRQRSNRDTRTLVGLGVVLVVAAIALGFPHSSERAPLRTQAGGAFMPPDLGYIVACSGAVLLLVAGFDALRLDRAPRWLDIVGRHSLLVYVAHFPLVKITAAALPHRVTLAPAMGLVAINLGLLALGALIWERLWAWGLELRRSRRA